MTDPTLLPGAAAHLGPHFHAATAHQGCHRHRIHVAPFYVDRTPVTNAEFKKFLDATRYRPRDDHNFLRDWRNGNYPEGWDRKPVTWVSIEDARPMPDGLASVCHEWEWQFAAQSADGRLYPWGSEWNSKAVPTLDRGHTMHALTNVDALPQGASRSGARP